MDTQIECAKKGIITNEMKYVAKAECMPIENIINGVASYKIAILKNNSRIGSIPVGIGENLKTKINATLGISDIQKAYESELDKLRISEMMDVDLLYDNSYSANKYKFLTEIITKSMKPIGTNSTYNIAYEYLKEKKDYTQNIKEKILKDFEDLCKIGIDYIKIYCGVNQEILKHYKPENRIYPVDSSGGGFLITLMKSKQIENPYFETFDEIIEIAKKYDVTLLFGNVFKSGSVFDGMDEISLYENILNSKLITKAHKANVQAMIESVGNITLSKIPTYIEFINSLTKNTPIYLTNSKVCDNTTGYEQITNSIGAANFAMYGASVINAVCAYNSFKYPTASQFKSGIITAKIAMNCADLSNKNSDLMQKNKLYTKAKNNLNIDEILKNSIDSTVFKSIPISKNQNFSKKYFDENFD